MWTASGQLVAGLGKIAVVFYGIRTMEKMSEECAREAPTSTPGSWKLSGNATRPTRAGIWRPWPLSVDPSAARRLRTAAEPAAAAIRAGRGRQGVTRRCPGPGPGFAGVPSRRARARSGCCSTPRFPRAAAAQAPPTGFRGSS